MVANPAILMTEPDRFAVQGGVNPHTRLEDGRLKTVDMGQAVREWHRFAQQLADKGVEVYVVPYVDGLTGMVFPANAGVVARVNERCPVSQKAFFASEFAAAHRVAERPHFTAFMQKLGFPVGELPPYKFEGEADFFPVGRPGAETFVFTFGELAPTTAVPGTGEGGRKYGFRSDERLAEVLSERVARGRTVVGARLIDPRYYHGDTCFCAADELLLFYPAAVDETSRARVRAAFPAAEGRLLELGDEDAARFVANSFFCRVGNDRILFLPRDASDAVTGPLRERGLHLEQTSLTEFLGKGGGGGKCMVFNIGALVDDPAQPPSAEVLAFRHARRYETLRQSGAFARHGVT
jgi:N-dimethylarginine dimethylaminohydrolase